jgi:flagellar biosynthesis chaperone FliJ
MLKRQSASFKSIYNFEDTLLKPAEIAFQKNNDKSHTPLEVDTSKIVTTPFAHGLRTAYIQIKKPISDYEHVFLNCIEKSDGDMTLEEYLKELEKVIKNYEEAITQKINACKSLFYAIKEEEKDKLNLPYNITELKTDYELAQTTYKIEQETYGDIRDTKKQIDTEFNYLVIEKERLQKELDEVTAIATGLGIKLFVKKDPAKRVEGVNETEHDEEMEMSAEEGTDVEKQGEEKLQNRDPEVENEMEEGESPKQYSGVLGVLYNVIYGTWYVLKVAWYGIKTIEYGVRKTWAIASDIKGFLQDKPAQIQLAKLLYKEIMTKMREIDSSIKMLKSEHESYETKITESEKEGLSESTINVLQRNVDITFERLRRFEYVRESSVGPKMTAIFEEIYNTIWSRLQINSTKEQDYILTLIQFPSKFSMENFLKENDSAYLTEEEIGINIPELANMALQQVKMLSRKTTPPSLMPKMRQRINSALYQLDKDPMEPVADCTNQLILPSYDDYIIAYNMAQSKKWSGLIC